MKITIAAPLLFLFVFPLEVLSEDPLIKNLDADYSALLENDPHAAEIRQAEKLLRETNRSSTWTNYFGAVAIIRDCRSKAAIPLLLKYSMLHSQHTTRSVQAYWRTIAMLTGYEFPQLSSIPHAERLARTQQLARKFCKEWWNERKDTFSTNLADWDQRQIQDHVFRVVNEVKRRVNFNEKLDAGKARSIVTYDLRELCEEPDRDWFDGDLHACMLPVIMARCGHDLATGKSTRNANKKVPFELAAILCRLRLMGEAQFLNELAADEAQNSSTRLVSAWACNFSGDRVSPDVFFSVLENDKRLEFRLSAVCSLGSYSDHATANRLAELLDHSNTEIRVAAWMMLEQMPPTDLLPLLADRLKKDIELNKRVRILPIIANYKNDEAREILAEHLEYVSTQRHSINQHRVQDVLSAFETATGKDWYNYHHRGNNDNYFNEKAAEAVAWWKRQKQISQRVEAVPEALLHFDNLKNAKSIPKELLVAYGSFFEAMQKDDIQALKGLVIAESIQFENAGPTTPDTERWTIALPLEFSGLPTEMKINGDACVIKTNTSTMRWINTASDGWKLIAIEKN